MMSWLPWKRANELASKRVLILFFSGHAESGLIEISDGEAYYVLDDLSDLSEAPIAVRPVPEEGWNNWSSASEAIDQKVLVKFEDGHMVTGMVARGSNNKPVFEPFVSAPARTDSPQGWIRFSEVAPNPMRQARSPRTPGTYH